MGIQLIKILKWTIAYVIVMFSIILACGILGEVEFSSSTLVTILSGEFQPNNFWQSVAMFFVILFQLFPAFAFLEVRTMTKEEKLEIRISMLENHIIIVGLNNIAQRASQTLDDLDIPYVFIIQSRLASSPRVANQLEELQQRKAIILQGITASGLLEKAGIKNARGILITGNQESENILIAQKAKQLNPNVKTVVRVYNADVAKVYRDDVVDEYISSSLMVNMVYVLGCYMDVDRQYPPAIRFYVEKGSRLDGKKRSQVEKSTGIAILGVLRGENLVRDDIILQTGDRLFIYGKPQQFKKLIEYNIS